MAKVLLLSPGAFSTGFFDYYLDEYKLGLGGFDFKVLQLPSREANLKEITDPILLDAEFIFGSVQAEQPDIVIGISTSAASLLECMRKYSDTVPFTPILIFPGEFLSKYNKVLAHKALELMQRSTSLRKLFSLYLKLKFSSYRRKDAVSFEQLVFFYQKILVWKFSPFNPLVSKCLILHAKSEPLLDKQSRYRIAACFPQAKIEVADCTHEPSDKCAEVIFAILRKYKYYLAM